MPSKILVAFDFDHTIIDDNSDIHVQKLSPDGFSNEIKNLYKKDNWTEYMGAIFKHLHSIGVTQSEILACMEEMPLVDGMVELFDYLRDDQFDTIIISDSNSVFIDHFMKEKGLDDVVSAVYTNPAEFDSEGRLLIEFYHHQDWCKMSTRNLCKGHILDAHIKEQSEKGINYDMVAFVGDGSNDFCPCLRLRSQDLALARKEYRLEQKIKQGEPPIQARVEFWETGLDIKDALACNRPTCNSTHV